MNVGFLLLVGGVVQYYLGEWLWEFYSILTLLYSVVGGIVLYLYSDDGPPHVLVGRIVQYR